MAGFSAATRLLSRSSRRRVKFMGLLRLSLMIISLLLFWVRVEAIDISATGGWTKTMDASDLISGPGSDLHGDHESAPAVTTLTISKCRGRHDRWRVDVKRMDSARHAEGTLYVKRVTDGVGRGSISGGHSFIKIERKESRFFWGSGNREDVDLQYKLAGVSIGISPGNYSTRVVFTVVDIP